MELLPPLPEQSTDIETIVILTIGEIVMRLNYKNTMVKTYAMPEFDHILYSGNAAKLRIRTRLDGEYIQQLKDLGFAYQFSPDVDNDTREWIMREMNRTTNPEIPDNSVVIDISKWAKSRNRLARKTISEVINS